MNLTEDAQIEAAFAEARTQSKSRAILVESFVTGMDHRMLVVNWPVGGEVKRVPGDCDGRRQINDCRVDRRGER